MEAQSPPSKLPRRALNNGKSAGSVSYGLTLMQLQELEQQSVIYNYIEAGIPVPTYLILPIWKSFPSSISNRFYPNLAVFNYNMKNSMESEPGRCRRTDGKKWRCNKNVVHGQKYCHRHLHRGRLRSEHHLQPPSAAAAAAATATTTTT